MKSTINRHWFKFRLPEINGTLNQILYCNADRYMWKTSALLFLEHYMVLVIANFNYHGWDNMGTS